MHKIVFHPPTTTIMKMNTISSIASMALRCVKGKRSAQVTSERGQKEIPYPFPTSSYNAYDTLLRHHKALTMYRDDPALRQRQAHGIEEILRMSKRKMMLSGRYINIISTNDETLALFWQWISFVRIPRRPCRPMESKDLWRMCRMSRTFAGSSTHWAHESIYYEAADGSDIVSAGD